MQNYIIITNNCNKHNYLKLIIIIHDQTSFTRSKETNPKNPPNTHKSNQKENKIKEKKSSLKSFSDQAHWAHCSNSRGGSRPTGPRTSS